MDSINNCVQDDDYSEISNSEPVIPPERNSMDIQRESEKRNPARFNRYLARMG